jgi:hypothetical protein
MYYTNFSDQLWSGELYPRWMHKMNAGLGSPTFYYYPPFAYYITSVLKPLFTEDPNGWHQLGISAAIALIASGMFMFLWLRKIVSPGPALLGAVIYIIIPYHVAEDLYGRGAFAEVWAFVWMPLILYFALGVHRKARFQGLGLAACCALLILTHLLTTMMFLPVLLAYAFYLGYSERNFGSVLKTAGAICLAFGLTSVYWVTALSLQEFVLFEKFRSGYFHYGNWLLGKSLHLGGSLRYFWMPFEVVVLLGSVFLVAVSRLNRLQRTEFLFWSAVIVSAVFMMASLSAFIWKVISPLQMIQFPWRFNAILAVAICPVVAFSATILKRSRRLPDIGAIAIIALVCIIWVQGAAKKAYTVLRNPNDRSMGETRDRMLLLGQDTDALRPVWASLPGNGGLETPAYNAGESAYGSTAEINVKYLNWKPGDIEMTVDSVTENTVKVRHFYFPGWKAYLADGRILAVKPSRPDGLISIDLPGGFHRIRLRLEKTPAERKAQWISLASLLIAAGAIAAGFLRREQQRIRNAD